MTQIKDFVVMKGLWEEFQEYKKEKHNDYFRKYNRKAGIVSGRMYRTTGIHAHDKKQYAKQYFQKITKPKRRSKNPNK